MKMKNVLSAIHKPLEPCGVQLQDNRDISEGKAHTFWESMLNGSTGVLQTELYPSSDQLRTRVLVGVGDSLGAPPHETGVCRL